MVWLNQGTQFTQVCVAPIAQHVCEGGTQEDKKTTLDTWPDATAERLVDSMDLADVDVSVCVDLSTWSWWNGMVKKNVARVMKVL